MITAGTAVATPAVETVVGSAITPTNRTTQLREATGAAQIFAALDNYLMLIALLLSTIPLVTIVGNILVVLAILTEKTLKSSTNLLLLSLAVADLVVGVAVMPFAIYLVAHHLSWYLPPVLCDIFIISDVTASTASIVHLTAISIDRYFAVVRHLEYSQAERHKKRIYTIIGSAWLFSIGVGLPLGPILVVGVGSSSTSDEFICAIDNPDYMLYGSLLAFWLPSAVMVTMYGIVFYKLNDRLQTVKFQEKAAARMVQFSTHMVVDQQCQSEGVNNSDLAWVRPFARKMEASIRHQGNDLLSMKDVNELTGILNRLENSENFLRSASNKVNFLESTSMEDTEAMENGSFDIDLDTIPAFPTSTSSSFRHQVRVGDGDVTAKRSMASLRRGSLQAITRQQSNTLSQATGSRRASRAVSHHTPGRRIRRWFRRRVRTMHSELVKKKRQFAARRLGNMRSRAYELIMKMRSKQGMQIRKETRATKLVTTVMVVFLLCWVPFFTMNLVKVYYLRWNLEWPAYAEVAFIVFAWLGYFNSALNPIIYSLINRRFRMAFHKLLTLQDVRRRYRRYMQTRSRNSTNFFANLAADRRRSSTRQRATMTSRRETYKETVLNVQQDEKRDRLATLVECSVPKTPSMTRVRINETPGIVLTAAPQDEIHDAEIVNIELSDHNDSSPHDSSPQSDLWPSEHESDVHV